MPVQGLKHLCPIMVLLSAKIQWEEVEADADLTGLSKANNNGFNELFGYCLHCSHRLYRVGDRKCWECGLPEE